MHDEIHLRAKDTKARRPRELPLSQRFRALLEMRRLDARDVPGRTRRSTSVAPRVANAWQRRLPPGPD
jgi:hypothetical protein